MSFPVIHGGRGKAALDAKDKMYPTDVNLLFPGLEAVADESSYVDQIRGERLTPGISDTVANKVCPGVYIECFEMHMCFVQIVGSGGDCGLQLVPQAAMHGLNVGQSIQDYLTYGTIHQDLTADRLRGCRLHRFDNATDSRCLVETCYKWSITQFGTSSLAAMLLIQLPSHLSIFHDATIAHFQ